MEFLPWNGLMRVSDRLLVQCTSDLFTVLSFRPRRKPGEKSYNAHGLTRSLSSVEMTSYSWDTTLDSKDRPGHKELFYLLCSLVDLYDLCVPVNPLNLVFVDVAVPAVHLERLISAPHRYLA